LGTSEDIIFCNIGKGQHMKTLFASAVLAVCCLSGCAEPAAVAKLVSAAEEALVTVAQADAHVEEAMLRQMDEQAVSLDEAFLADMDRLEIEQGGLSIEDVASAKNFYDQKRSALNESRRNLRELFRRRAASLQAAREMLDYARNLTIRNRAVSQDVEHYLQFLVRSRQQFQSSSSGGNQP
jgi:outer membrane murein-binding lipoprotein Lpp